MVPVPTTNKVERFKLRLDQEAEPFSGHDYDRNIIVVVINWNYKKTEQCPGDSPLELYEEDCVDAGNKPIVAFEIRNVRELCEEYKIVPHNGKIRISRIIKAILVNGLINKLGLCQEEAAEICLKLIEKHNLNEIEFHEK